MASTKLTLQSILQQGYQVYERHHPLPGYVRRAVQAILACRTAILGGHVQACPEGHLERIWDNSCRHRMCPPCGWLQVTRWLLSQQARLLACEHYHVIFTIPSELHDLWLGNVAMMPGVARKYSGLPSNSSTVSRTLANRSMVITAMLASHRALRAHGAG